jgi:hypothetical protein
VTFTQPILVRKLKDKYGDKFKGSHLGLRRRKAKYWYEAMDLVNSNQMKQVTIDLGLQLCCTWHSGRDQSVRTRCVDWQRKCQRLGSCIKAQCTR